MLLGIDQALTNPDDRAHTDYSTSADVLEKIAHDQNYLMYDSRSCSWLNMYRLIIRARQY